MEDYKSNSDKARQEQQSEKKVEAVITGAAKLEKKARCKNSQMSLLQKMQTMSNLIF